MDEKSKIFAMLNKEQEKKGKKLQNYEEQAPVLYKDLEF